jgi:6,7-dimethyl-8-ribityllumazine synthase
MSLDSPTALAVDGSAFRVGIVAARFNETLVNGLIASATETFRAAGVPEANLTLIRVPGSGELPFGAQMLLAREALDVVLALGVIIKGGTMHDQLVAEAAQQGLIRVGLDAKTTVIVGVVTANDHAQAEARCLGKINRGGEFAQTALEMVALKKRISS